jgi:hypothetical protein
MNGVLHVIFFPNKYWIDPHKIRLLREPCIELVRDSYIKVVNIWFTSHKCKLGTTTFQEFVSSRSP